VSGAGETTSIRLETGILERADALVEWLAGDARVAAHGAVKRTTVLRLALLRGLEALERERRRESQRQT